MLTKALQACTYHTIIFPLPFFHLDANAVEAQGIREKPLKRSIEARYPHDKLSLVTKMREGVVGDYFLLISCIKCRSSNHLGITFSPRPS